MVIKRMALAAPVAGVLLGVLDFVWIKFVPAPFGGLGNSIAVWAVVAFLLTFRNRWSLVVSVVGAVVCLVVAVPFYYLAATVIQNDDLSNAYNSTALLWMGLGVAAGAVFGAGGAIARTPGVPATTAAAAMAMPGAVLFAEAVIELRRIGDPSYGAGELIAYAGILIALGLIVTALVATSWSRRGLVLLISLPLTAIGYVLLSLTGFR
ncbi:hypothetical protein KOI35_06980 [Actinoplanes bogorensis]|uniref:Permease n=1 Tax=Paractinoplanes bogorensis TaxID=1610840 RepID=A0ABS5YIK0_9ACTN|nr:DUF6518 family protein [Actinoplanes bogorensis]MBU2663250.1 hypothetical protein [Actinoplanes bogorensis]